MRSLKKHHLLVALLVLQFGLCARAQDVVSQPIPQLKGAIGEPPSGYFLTLQKLEEMAIQNNPTLSQATSAVRSSRALARQAGMLPNPVVGYQSEEFAFGSLHAKPEYFGFFEQTLPLGGKLAKSRNIYLSQTNQAEVEVVAQRQRVINTVRLFFYQMLGIQEQVELRTELAKIAHNATKTTSDLFNVGQADKPDYLQSEIEAEQVEHELQVAKNNLGQTWKLLAAVVGIPEMTEVHLQGKLDDRIPAIDENALLANLIRTSPQIRSAEAQVEKARAVVTRAKAEPVPDMYVRGGIGYSSEFLENNRGNVIGKTGVEANAQVGISLPVWNRNQGGIAAAQADLAFAESELARVRLALRVQFAQEVKNYSNAVDAVRRYRDLILPRADEAYRLYSAKYKQMAASYPQMLISQRTMFQVRQQYINALVELQQTSTALEGFLLTGGLDAPSLTPGGGMQRVETTGVRSGSQGADQHDLDTAGLVEY